MTDEVFLTPCRPHVTRQVVECVSADDHAVHRKLTELVHFLCNCGFSSGWVPVDTLSDPSDFLAEHAPSADIRELAGRRNA